MMNLYELLGRKEAELAGWKADYDQLLGLVQRIKAGEVNPQAVVIDAEKRSWEIRAPVVLPDDGVIELPLGDEN